MGKADDAADDQGAVSSRPIQKMIYETKAFLLARWLDTG